MQSPGDNNSSKQKNADSEVWRHIEEANELSDKATETEGKAADQLFEQAYSKYDAALKLEPELHDALFNWASALIEQAATKTGEEADGLYVKAYEKYEAALRLEPDDFETLHNWGVALMEQAEVKDAAERDQLLRQAEERLTSAESISSGISAYVLAGLTALQGREEDCKKWLMKAKESGELAELADEDILDLDPDFDSVRDKDWYREIVDSL